MKIRTLTTLLLVSFMITSVTAQKAKHFDIGLQGGYGSVWILNQNNYGLPEMDYEYTWGGGFNFQAGYNFSEQMGVFSEIGVLNLGQKYKDKGAGNSEIKRSVELKYLNVPVFFKYSYGESRARFRLLFGPQFCFLQKAEQTYQVNDKDFSFDIQDKDGHTFDAGATEIKDRFNSMDIAVVLDLGADIFLVTDMLYLSAGARVFYGMTDINASAFQLNNNDGNYEPSHNAGVTFMFGIHYIIGGKSN